MVWAFFTEKRHDGRRWAFVEKDEKITANSNMQLMFSGNRIIFKRSQSDALQEEAFVVPHLLKILMESI